MNMHICAIIRLLVIDVGTYMQKGERIENFEKVSEILRVADDLSQQRLRQGQTSPINILRSFVPLFLFTLH